MVLPAFSMKPSTASERPGYWALISEFSKVLRKSPATPCKVPNSSFRSPRRSRRISRLSLMVISFCSNWSLNWVCRFSCSTMRSLVVSRISSWRLAFCSNSVSRWRYSSDSATRSSATRSSNSERLLADSWAATCALAPSRAPVTRMVLNFMKLLTVQPPEP